MKAKKIDEARERDQMEATLAVLLLDLGFKAAHALNSDRDDFRDLAVWKVAEALKAAYRAGRPSTGGRKPRRSKLAVAMDHFTGRDGKTIAACWYANERGERLCNACWRRPDILERGWKPETRTPVASTCFGCGKEVS